MKSINKYELLLLDAANTIIHKPDFWVNFIKVLKNYNIEVNVIELKKRHKIISEMIHFPDRTSADFYKVFNYKVLLSMGIVAEEQLLNEIFAACTYLSWHPFEDSFILENLVIRKAILSNFNSSLNVKIKDIFGERMFEKIIGSEDEKVGKPDIKFYKGALQALNVEPERVLYIGDSLKLDVIPAQSIGIDAWLIDRDKLFMNFEKRINSLTELNKLIQ
jgi:putative hydrolase of the HAD superfamily